MGFHHEWAKERHDLHSATDDGESHHADLPTAEKDGAGATPEDSAPMTVWEWAYAVFRAPVPLVDYDAQLEKLGRGRKP